jgi:hypothetical protein
MRNFLSAMLLCAGLLWASTGLDQLGRHSYFDDTFPLSTSANEGGTIPDNNWVSGTFNNGTGKCYHLHSFGGSSEEGIIDQVTNDMVVY